MLLELEKPEEAIALIEPPLELQPVPEPVVVALELQHEKESSESIEAPTSSFSLSDDDSPSGGKSGCVETVKSDPHFLGIKASRWTGATLAIASANLLLRDPVLMSIGLLGFATKLAYPQLKKFGGQKWKLHLATTVATAVVAGLGLHLHISSAQALFFEEAESFLSETFELSGDAVETIFNVFRAVYVVYLIYSAISIWTAYNRDEDWMSVAKAPIVIFVGGTLIDAVTAIITA